MELPEEFSKGDCSDEQEYIAFDSVSNIDDNDCDVNYIKIAVDVRSNIGDNDYDVNYIKDYCEEQRMVIKELSEMKLKLQTQIDMLLSSIGTLDDFLSRVKNIGCLAKILDHCDLVIKKEVKKGLKITQCFVSDYEASDKYVEKVIARYEELVSTEAKNMDNLVAESNTAEEELVMARTECAVWNDKLHTRQGDLDSTAPNIEDFRSVLEQADANVAKLKMGVETVKEKEQALRKADILKEIEFLKEQKAILQIEVSANKETLNHMEHDNNMMKTENLSLRAEMKQNKEKILKLKSDKDSNMHRRMNSVDVALSRRDLPSVKRMLVIKLNKKKAKIQIKSNMCQEYVNHLLQLCERLENVKKAMEENEEVKEESDAKSQKEYLDEKYAKFALVPAKQEKIEMVLNKNDEQVRQPGAFSDGSLAAIMALVPVKEEKTEIMLKEKDEQALVPKMMLQEDDEQVREPVAFSDGSLSTEMALVPAKKEKTEMMLKENDEQVCELGTFSDESLATNECTLF